MGQIKQEAYPNKKSILTIEELSKINQEVDFELHQSQCKMIKIGGLTNILTGIFVIYISVTEVMKSVIVLINTGYVKMSLDSKKIESLIYEKKEYNLSNQLFRSATSIGANVEEAIGGQSKKDFIAKISIAYKEARETRYWIRLSIEIYPEYESVAKSLLNDCEELLKMSAKTIITSKNTLK